MFYFLRVLENLKIKKCFLPFLALKMINVDVCVLGSGPGGYVAAIKLGQSGLSVACVEKENVGGICLNWGCIPTKALLHCAESCSIAKKSISFGVDLEVKNIDIKKMVNYSRDVVKKLSGGVELLFKKNKVKLIRGFGFFQDKNTLEVKSEDGSVETVKAKYFIIATGASPRTLNYEIDNDLICTYRGAMVPNSVPKEVVIIGGGVIGIEFACFYNAIGSKVHILEICQDILMAEDLEIRKRAKNSFINSGIDIHTALQDITYKKKGKQVVVEYKEDGKKYSLTADKLILSVGVIPNVTGFGLEKTGVILDKNCIKTDDVCKTNIDNIYAIGDCTYGPWLAHKASREGIIAVEDIAKREGKIANKSIFTPINKNNIPGCIYSFPQIASIGLTEEQVKEKKIKYKVGTFSGVGNGKSIAADEMDNFVKVLFDENTHELLGVHAIGSNMTEIIHALVVAKSAELLPEDIDSTIFAHPTVSEMISEAVLDAFGKAIHK